MKEFNIPADFQNETLDQLALLNSKHQQTRVSEVYGNITIGTHFASGRATQNLPEVNLEKLAQYIARAKQHNIAFNYTFNATHLNNNEFHADTVRRLKALLHDLDNAGVTTLIVALPTLYEIIRSTGLGFRIKASVLSEVTTANRALALKNMGADRIVPDESITRDFRALKQIVKVFGDEVEVIANAWCSSHCQYRMFHYNQMSSEDGTRDSSASNSYYSNRCYSRMFQEISNFLKMNWIRPEDLHYYSKIGINRFKLQGRHLLNLKVENRRPLRGDLMRTVEAYLDEKFDGNLFDLISLFNPAYVFRVNWDNRKLEEYLRPFVENEDFCRRDCSACKYCESFAKQVVNIHDFKAVEADCQRFFAVVDAFRGMVWKDNVRKPPHFPL